jgi:hypothetical protein
VARGAFCFRVICLSFRFQRGSGEIEKPSFCFLHTNKDWFIGSLSCRANYAGCMSMWLDNCRTVKKRASQTGPLFGAQSLNRIDGCGPQRGKQAGDDSDEGKCRGGRGESYRIEGGHSVEHSFHESFCDS